MYIKRLPLGDIGANCYVICDENTGIGAVIDPGVFGAEVKNAIERSGMKDSFQHVSVIEEKTPLHLGGEKKVNFVLDDDYFFGKVVLVFDDILTTGGSVELCRQEVEKVGVISERAIRKLDEIIESINRLEKEEKININ